MKEEKKQDVVSLGNEGVFDGKVNWPDNEEIIRRIELERDNAIGYRAPFVNDWHENEDLLYCRKKKILSKRTNVMLPLAAGYEDVFLSHLRTPITIVFEGVEPGDTKKALKATSLFEFETSVTREDWEFKDIMTKKLGIVSGRGINKIYAEYPYKHRLDPVDHYDFWIDPLTNGMNLESARYLGQDNIVLSKAQLEKNPSYDKEEVTKLIGQFPDNNAPDHEVDNTDKSHRLLAVGATLQNFTQSGEPSYIFTEAYTQIDGIRVYVLYNREKKVIIKKTELENITGFLKGEQQAFYPYESWAYYPDLFNFWSIAPLTRVREIFYLRNVALNQIFDAGESKTRPMRAFDPKTFTDASKLVYSPDALIPTAGGRDPSKGIYTFAGESISDPSSIDSILETLGNKITGMNSGATANEINTQKVGIYYGNMQELEKRMTLFELSYNRFHLRLAQKYLKFASDRLEKIDAIKILGTNGVEYDEITQEDLVDFDINITGGVSKASADSLTKKAKADALAQLAMSQIVNQKVRVELALGIVGFNKDEIKRLLDSSIVDQNQLVRADEDIQKILTKKKFRKYLKADIQYMKRIFDFVYDHDLSKEDEELLLKYIEEIQPVVIRNVYLRAKQELLQKQMAMSLTSAPGPSPDSPALTGAKNAMPVPPEDVATAGAQTMQQAETVPSLIQEQY